MELGKKHVLVTGAGGFIGSHLVEALFETGFNIKAFVHYNSFDRRGWLDYLRPEILNSIEIFTGDIRDFNAVRKALENSEIVFHLAALVGIPYSYYSPDAYLETNIRGTLNILQASRDTGVKKIIHTSTSEVYGTAQFVPITEEHPLNPQSPYAATKSAADFLALTFFRSFNTPVAIVRPFNTYGPRQSMRAIVPTIITQIQEGKKQIELGSVNPTRDFTYVTDTVNGFIKISESENSIGEVINIGSCFEISIKDLAERIAGLMGTSIDVISKDERRRPDKSEVERLFAETSKAKQLLKWNPEISLDKGLMSTIKWFGNEDNRKLFRSGNYTL